MHFYSIHVIAKHNLSGSEIICRQINATLLFFIITPYNIKNRNDLKST